jgi:competence protein ComEC
VPRAAWLALGAAGAALAVPVAGAVAVLLTGASVLLAASGLQAAARAAPWRRLAPIALGIVVVGLREAAGGVAPPVGAVPAGSGPWPATVQSVGAPRAGTRPATVLLDANTPVLVAATLPWYPPVVPGDRVTLSGRVRAPPDDDFGAYLARIGAVGTLRSDRLELLPRSGTFPDRLESLRRVAAGGLDRAMPEPEAGLAAGVLVGLRDRVDRDLSAAFTTAGASHVVAISGWNIAIVASTVAAIGGGLRRRRRAVLTAAAILVYVAFVGPSASVVRAAVMAGVALLARELGRPGTAAAALGWAVAGLLAVDPAWIDDAGFRLSVLATAGIIAWGSSLTDRLSGPSPGRIRRWIAEILGVSFAAQAATTPVVLLEFGRLSVVAPLVNLVVVPLVPPAMATGALALVVGVLAGAGLPSILAVLVGLPAWALYAAMVAVVRFGAGLPLSSIELAPPWDAVSAGLSVVTILGIARWGGALTRPGRGDQPATPSAAGGDRRAERTSQTATKGAAVALVGATIALALAVAYRPGGVPHVVVLDVGQGDAILVDGGHGGRMLVDGGPDPGRLLVALGERLPPWDRRIDIVVLTHPHEDHVAGLGLLLDRYAVGAVYESGLPGESPGYAAWVAELADGVPPRGRLAAGDRLRLDEIAIRVLWPVPGSVPARPLDDGKAINNTSVVLLGTVGPRRFLLMGDLEEDMDPELMAAGLPAVDLLKVAHHGSRTATTPELLDALHPSLAAISVGTDNDYGHPAPELLARLADRGIRTFRTDLDATIDVTLGPTAVTVHATRQRGSGRAAAVAAYHRVDADRTARSNRIAPRDRSPRLLLGRRRVRARGGARCVPERCGPVPRRRTRTVATRGRAHRTRAPPRGDSRAPRDGLDVRRGQRRDPARRGWPDPQQRGARPAPRGARDDRVRQRPGDRRGDRLWREGPAEQDSRRRDSRGGW